MPSKTIRNTLIGLEAFVVLMAIYGGIAMLIDAAGFGLKPAWLHDSPFSNYQIPAVALLVLVGGSSFLAILALFRGQVSWGAIASIVAGVILIAFEIVETYAIGVRNFQQPLMFVIGLVIAGLGLVLMYLGMRERAAPRRGLERHRRSA